MLKWQICAKINEDIPMINPINRMQSAKTHQQQIDCNNNNVDPSCDSNTENNDQCDPGQKEPVQSCQGAAIDNNNLPTQHRPKQWPRVLKSRIKFDPPTGNLSLARELIDAFTRHKERTLLIDATSGRRWNGSQMLDASGRIACGLNELAKVRPNDVVMLVCEHLVEETLMALGIVLSGAALYGVSLSDGFDDNKCMCEIVPPDVLIIPSRWHSQAVKLRAQVKGMSSCRIVWSDDFESSSGHSQNGLDMNNNVAVTSQVLTYGRLLQHRYDQQLLDMIADEWIDPVNHISTYMLTSGSTGRPKIVPSTHSEIVYGLKSVVSATKNPIGSNDELGSNEVFELLGRQGEIVLPISLGECMSGDLPLDHGAGLNTMFVCFHNGAEYVRMPAYDEHVFWQAVSDYGITVSISSTTFGYKLLVHLKQLIDSNQTDRYDLSKFRFMTCCGAKLAYKSLATEVCRHYKHLSISQAYGCTEIGFISLLPISDSSSHRESVGYLFPGLQAKLIERFRTDPNDGHESDQGPEDDPLVLDRQYQPIRSPDIRGELLLWAQSKFQSYKCHRDEVGRSERIFKESQLGRFYRTGDQAHIDRWGRLYVHGRFKDTLFLMEDWKVMPAELEQLIDQHPLVEQSVVVGVPDETLQGCDAPRAFCQLIRTGSISHEQFLLESESRKDAQRETTINDKGDIDLDCLVAWLANDDKCKIAKHIYEFTANRTAEPKHLKGGVCIVDDFPRVGHLNKVDRKALKQYTHVDYQK